MRRIAYNTLLSITAGIMAFISEATASQTKTPLTDHDVTFHVLVVDAPCNVSTEARDIVVNMNEVSTQDIKANGYGSWHDFTINLTDCNLDTYQSVTVSFLGREESLLPKRLALDSLSNARGIAIGIYHDNKLMGINDSTGAIALQSGDNAIPFSARIEKIRDDLIQAGDYVATANFKLSYL